MKNIDKAKLLNKIKKFFEENNINIESCGCCGGYHLEVKGEELCSGENFKEEVQNDINYFKENSGKIPVHFQNDAYPEITFIKDDDKIVNLGGRSYPFNKYFKRCNNKQLLEYFKLWI